MSKCKNGGGPILGALIRDCLHLEVTLSPTQSESTSPPEVLPKAETRAFLNHCPVKGLSA